ncbi:DUF962 domain-containing protein [Luteimonas huabeiensis]|uniref:DUF962 domain-containing protein n=1 Tax=Luteimonas huabeiensis TaxID=1244513 RepID=UPI00046564CD|nr:DUF962 domain-containing protein [Luteimonas huabeiensis]
MARSDRGFSSFREFYPYYLSEHAHPVSRRLHFVGSWGVLVLVAVAAWRREPAWLLAALACGYGFAWIGHFFFEKNRPGGEGATSSRTAPPPPTRSQRRRPAPRPPGTIAPLPRAGEGMG